MLAPEKSKTWFCTLLEPPLTVTEATTGVPTPAVCAAAAPASLPGHALAYIIWLVEATSPFVAGPTVNTAVATAGTKALSATTADTVRDTPTGLKGPAAEKGDTQSMSASPDDNDAKSNVAVAPPAAERVSATLTVPRLAARAAVTAAAEAGHPWAVEANTPWSVDLMASPCALADW